MFGLDIRYRYKYIQMYIYGCRLCSLSLLTSATGPIDWNGVVLGWCDVLAHTIGPEHKYALHHSIVPDWK